MSKLHPNSPISGESRNTDMRDTFAVNSHKSSRTVAGMNTYPVTAKSNIRPLITCRLPFVSHLEQSENGRMRLNKEWA